MDLSIPEKTWDKWLYILDDAEQKKAARLVQAKHRWRALAVRIQLRLLLSKYMSIAAHEIEFGVGEYGKPYVKNSDIKFNISHSGDRTLVAISLLDGLGVDIEYWRPLDNLRGLVKRNFSHNEQMQWENVSGDDKLPTFFKLWSVKEAFIKATGRGLGLGLTRCSFSLESTKLLDCPNEYGSVDGWSCIIMDEDGVSAAMVVKSRHCTIKRQRFSSEHYP
ncbi:MAG: hypothetical protein A6F71_01980 [Cycloclasticus sp. symbiont of Poecilosclerida sp. M]|nr:MAG: hypothetical protein A6F71_01980 [Cycloclasticus sp. symbiont of Poecilosclerida sp. M]